MNFLMIDRKGNPNTSQYFKEAVEALYCLSYTLKFMIKKGRKPADYGVMPLEGLWWMDDMTKFSEVNKDLWLWTAMIMQPAEYNTTELVEDASEIVKEKKNPPALSKIKFENFTEGKVAQILHIGPFSEEGPTIKKVHNFIEENGFKRSGKHHEIYL